MKSAGRSLNEEDLYLFQEGTHVRLADVLGAHIVEHGVKFAVWAPRASAVSVVGSFNNWETGANVLLPAGNGLWQGFVEGLTQGERYKYRIEAGQGTHVDKADPVGFLHDQPPGNASVIWPLDYRWSDSSWMAERRKANSPDSPISIYEVHLGSFHKSNNQSYIDIGQELVPYVKEMGFTHVEFLPVMEHPFFGSWGYQTTGYYAPTSRFGSPQDFMQLIDHFHQNGIGVILDWTPAHFPGDEHGLGNFDGAHEYEHADARRGLHPDWNSFIFNYGRGPVRSFLLSSALFWLEEYHVDALRVDGVASMLYLDYSRKPGEWIPNEYGARENLDAIGFLRRLNEDVYRHVPDAQTIAEESTAWPLVSRPTYLGGLGFGFKWDLGWMHDTLQYLGRDPVHRTHHHHELTFRLNYTFTESFILPLSHDEVVHGKGSLLTKMHGDLMQKFANLRLLLAYMYAQPGKKLLFMGSEFGQLKEWNHDEALDWNLLNSERHAKLRLLVGDLNYLYRSDPALHTLDCSPGGFSWIEANDAKRSVLAFERLGAGDELMLVLCNFSGVAQRNYRVGVAKQGVWGEMLNTDSKNYGGSGQGNFGKVNSVPLPAHKRMHSLTVDLPPLTAIFLRPQSKSDGLSHA